LRLKGIENTIDILSIFFSSNLCPSS